MRTVSGGASNGTLLVNSESGAPEVEQSEWIAGERLHPPKPRARPRRIRLSSLLTGMFHLHGSLARLLWRDGRALQPLNLTMEVTYRCNLRCNFCQYLDVIQGTATTVGPVREVPLETIKSWIDDLPRGRLITFSGGEALVRKDFPEILAHASRHHRTHLISNGTLIDDRVAERFVDAAPRWPWQNGLVLLGISLEGEERRHDQVVQRPGSWRKTTNAIRALTRRRQQAGKRFPKINLMFVVTKDTVNGMVDFVYLAHELGVDIVNFIAEHDTVGHGGTLTGTPASTRIVLPQQPPDGVDGPFLRQQLIRCFELERDLGVELRLTPPGIPIDEFVRHYSAERTLDPSQYRCGSAWSRMHLGADGRYTPGCAYLRTGDARTDSLRDGWNGPLIREFRQNLERDRIYPGCSGCCNLRYVGPQAYGLADVDAGVAHNGGQSSCRPLR